MADLRRQLKLREKLSVWSDRKSIVVFTMGKVGTLTICNSLERIGIKHVHPHSLRYTRAGIHFLCNVRYNIFQNVYYCFKTFTKRIKVVLWRAFKKKIAIITGVRDPFSRSISAYFEQAHYLSEEPSKMLYEEVKESFDRHYNLDGAIDWFEEEIEKVFGIDVYSHSFDTGKGYQVIEKGKYRIFVYRIDFLNQLEEELRAFVGDPAFTLENENITTPSDNYQRLKREIRFSEEEFERMTQSKYMKHFYSADEVSVLRDKWVTA